MTEITLQNQMAIFLRGFLAKHQIQKQKIAELLSVSKVFITNITRSPGKLPSPDMLYGIIRILNSYGAENVEQYIDGLIKEYGDEEYRIRFYTAKLRALYGNDRLFSEFLKDLSNQETERLLRSKIA